MIEFDYARRSQRRTIDLPCDLVGRDWDRPLCHRIVDLSPHGAWVRTALPLQPGEQVVVGFRPPKWERELSLFATVKRSVRAGRGGARNGMALEFLDLTRAERRLLQHSLKGLPTTEACRHHVARLARL